MEKLKLAVAQIRPRLGDVPWNLAHHVDFVERAREEGSNLILFPELGLTGYSVRDLNSELALPINDKAFGKFKTLSKKISIVVGGIVREETGAIRNALIYFEAGEIKHVHFKVYLPTYGIFEEQRYFLPGKKVEAFDTKFGKIGLLICEDLWHISLPYLLALQGAKLILAAAASPTRLSGEGKEHSAHQSNSEQHKSISRLLSVFLAFTNRVGFEDGVNFWGGSEIVSPHGEVLAACKLYDEDLVSHGIDLAEVDRARLFARHFLDEDPALLMSHLKDLGY